MEIVIAKDNIEESINIDSKRGWVANEQFYEIYKVDILNNATYHIFFENKREIEVMKESLDFLLAEINE
jgi:hypothetical protein